MSHDTEKPLSALVAQGWEIVSFAMGHSSSGYVVEEFLLRRQRAHKLLILKPKLFGNGYTVKERDI